jgi:multidrug efflux system membrane fusion protein
MNPQAEAPPPVPRKPLSRRATLIGGFLALVLLAGLGALAWYLTHPAASSAAPGGGAAAAPGGPGGGGPGGPGGRRAGASTVGVASAERASIPVTLEALGTVTPQATVRVRPQVSGVLEKVLFSEGQMVKKGDLLATIDPRQFEMALMQASGQRLRDEAQLDSARVTLQRYKTLLEQDSIARQDVDTQAALVKQLEGTIAIDKANEGTARLNLGYTRVVAPVSGRVGLRTVDVGNVVSNSDTNGVALITQVAPIDVVFAVPQDQVSELQQLTGASPSAAAGMKVTALDRTRANVLDTGVFGSLDNQIDTTTGTVKAKARFANSKLTLFPNQFVNVQVLVRTIENAVVVPVTAVRKGNAGDYVYVLNPVERTVSVRPVQRGQATVDKIVITSGLQAGERVITEGADRLKDGAPVTLAGDAPRGAGAGAAAGKRRRTASEPEAAVPVPAGSAPAVAGPAAPASSSGRPAGNRPGASPAIAPEASSGSPSAAPAAAVATPAAATQALATGPSPEQRQRMLAQVKDDPVALERRQRFLAQLDKGDPEAIARWRTMENRRQGERPAQ